MTKPHRTAAPSLAVILAALGTLTGCAGSADIPARNPSARPGAFEFVALGDMPYHPEDHPKAERLVDRVNALSPSFTIHVGDTKSGGTPCDEAFHRRTLAWFQRFEGALIYTPGDNEWTDCHRDKAGRYDPLERLAMLRRLYFAEPRSQGRAPLAVERQADLSDFKDMVENARWEVGNVLFATLHVVGSNNNLGRTPEMDREYAARNRANLAWIDDTYREAARRGARGAVFFMQADPFFEVKGDARKGKVDGIDDTVAALARGAVGFGRPVLVVDGDSHKLRFDQPFTAPDGTPIERLFRLTVMGEDQIHAVRVTVDPSDPALFGVRPLLVPENIRSIRSH